MRYMLIAQPRGEPREAVYYYGRNLWTYKRENAGRWYRDRALEIFRELIADTELDVIGVSMIPVRD